MSGGSTDRATSDEAIAAAAERWPGLRIDPDAVRAYAATRLSDDEPEALEEVILGWACASGDPIAHALFDAHYLDGVAAHLAHMKLAPERVDEVRQQVRHKLLVAEPGGRTKLDDYVGQGRLRGLIKVVATRAAISLLRKQRPEAGEDALGGLVDTDYDPELGYMKATYRAAFRAAFEGAVRGLTSRERNILRLQLEAGLTVEQIGAVYGVHRATTTRWLTQIRQQLAKETRRGLQEALGIGADELDSLMVLIESRMDVSVRRMLEVTPPPEQSESIPASDRPSGPG